MSVVAGLVAEHVVDRPQPVEVDEEHRQRRLVPELVEPAEKRPPVRKAGRLVTQCLLRELRDLLERVLERAPGADAGAEQPSGLGDEHAVPAAEAPPVPEHGDGPDERVGRAERRGDRLPLRVVDVDEAALLCRFRRRAGRDLHRPGGRQVRREGDLARDEHEPEIGLGETHHRGRRGVEELHAGSPVEDAGHEVGEPAEAVLAPVDLSDRHPFLDGSEDRARIVTRTPERAGRSGAHLDGLVEADVEGHRESVTHTRHDPFERERVVETRDEQHELVAADRCGEARRHDLRKPNGGPLEQAVARLRGRAGR